MTSLVPLMGFDRYVELDWFRASLDVAVGANTPEQLQAVVAVSQTGKESQRKTLDVLKRLSTKPFSHLADFIARGSEIYKRFGTEAVLPLAWGGAVASYPFFGKTAEITGRLLRLQGDCSIKEIQRRMAEAYGDRSGVGRAVARVLQSQVEWGVLNRDDVAKRVLKKPPQYLDSEALVTWLIEAAVRHAGKAVSVPSIQSLPVLFPFNLEGSLAHFISNSPSLALRSDGPGNQFVTLRSVI